VALQEKAGDRGRRASKPRTARADAHLSRRGEDPDAGRQDPLTSSGSQSRHHRAGGVEARRPQQV